MKDIRESDLLDHLEVDLIHSTLNFCLDSEFLFAAALDFGGEDGPPRCDVKTDYSLDGVSCTSDQ